MVIKQRPSLLVTVGTAVLLVLGGTAAYVGIVRRLSTEVTLPVGMEIVPSETLATLTLTTDDSQWNRLRQLGTPESQKLLDSLLVDWRDRILSANGYRFRTDIQPWIGTQVTVAFLPKANAGDNATDMALVVPIADPIKAEEILAEPREGTTWIGRDYNSVAIQSVKTAAGDTYESAVLGNRWLVLATSANALEAVIDSFNGGLSIVDNDAYRQAFKQLTLPSALVQMYVNWPMATKTLSGSDNLPGINGVVAAVDLLSNGLEIEASTWLGPEDQPVYGDIRNVPSSMPERLPDSTVLMMSTSSIGPLWQALSDAERLDALLPLSSKSLVKGLKEQTGLDFENDILPWLAGDFALGLLPPTAADSPVPLGQLALVAEVVDRKAAETAWDQLNEVMVNRFRFDVAQSEVESQPVNQLVSYYGGIAMGYGWLEPDITFFGVGSEVVNAIAPRPPSTLKDHQAFRTLLSISPQENSGHFFLDVERLKSLQGTLPFPQLPDSPLFSAIESVGITTTVQDERHLGYHIFIELPKGRRVKPLPD